jgi:hypothetical protein
MHEQNIIGFSYYGYAQPKPSLSKSLLSSLSVESVSKMSCSLFRLGLFIRRNLFRCFLPICVLAIVVIHCLQIETCGLVALKAVVPQHLSVEMQNSPLHSLHVPNFEFADFFFPFSPPE